MAYRVRNYNLTIGYLNIQGLHNKNGCKLPHLVSELNNDIEILSEIWACECDATVEGYNILAQVDPQKRAGVRKGRKSGGIRILIKTNLYKDVKVLKKSNNFVWFEINHRLLENLQSNLIICASYIHDITSTYFTPSIFDELSKDILGFCNQDTPLIIMGDMNARTSTLEEYSAHLADDHQVCSIEIDNHTIPISVRQNCDKETNSHGKNVIELCNTFNLKILNGRSNGDPLGNFTYYDEKLGASLVDYSICSQNFYKHIDNFMTLPHNELSDHCKIVTEINGYIANETSVNDSYDWKNIPKKFHWNNDVKKAFVDYFSGAQGKINEINQRIDAGLINSTGKMI